MLLCLYNSVFFVFSCILSTEDRTNFWHKPGDNSTLLYSFISSCNSCHATDAADTSCISEIFSVKTEEHVWTTFLTTLANVLMDTSVHCASTCHKGTALTCTTTMMLLSMARMLCCWITKIVLRFVRLFVCLFVCFCLFSPTTTKYTEHETTEACIGD